MVGTKKRKSEITALYIITIVVMLLMIFPFIYLVIQSFAPWNEVDKQIIPSSFTLRSWQFLFGNGNTTADVPWIGAMLHTFFVSTVSTVLMIVTALMVGFALAKVKFRGKKLVDNFIIFQMFFPAIILLVPQFLLVTKVGLVNTFTGMILPTAVSMWAIFMYTNFFKAIPDALIEAARLDGANDFTILFKIVLPMSRSITTVIFLFLYTDRWTNLLWDMIISKSNDTVTLNVLISQMFGPYAIYPGPMYAASLILTAPIIILFLLFSKQFQKGMDFALK
ncbi:MAG: carbohydrate ABC transporter permease [Streptococcaceae bacterium]|jgi:multiple sugar transport system permease protein|nr:carbohydrate ABC transporter permease [Streptococcaceae bacterium]